MTLCESTINSVVRNHSTIIMLSIIVQQTIIMLSIIVQVYYGSGHVIVNIQCLTCSGDNEMG